MKRNISVLLVCASLSVPAAAAAQVAWDSPMLLPPRAQPGFGIFLDGPAGGDLGVMATFRSPSWNFGVRGGIAEESGRDNGLAVLAGFDFQGALTRSSTEFPLDVDWVLGMGFSVGDNFLVSVPLGLTTGHSFRGDGVVFTPYGTPRVVLDAFFGDGRSRVDLDLAFDLGLDLRFAPNFMVRFGATIADRSAVAIGLVF